MDADVSSKCKWDAAYVISVSYYDIFSSNSMGGCPLLDIAVSI